MSMTPILDNFSEAEIRQIKIELALRGSGFNAIQSHKSVKAEITAKLQKLYGYKEGSLSSVTRQFAEFIGVIAKKNIGLTNSCGSVRVPGNPREADAYKQEVDEILLFLENRFTETEGIREELAEISQIKKGEE